MAELRCEDLAAGYGGRAVLTGVNLTVAEGTLTAVLGASGSGKTTLLRIIVGFVPPARGRVVIGGTTMAEAGSRPVAPEKRAVGYVAQEGALYPHLSVGDNVGFGLSRHDRKEGGRVGETLELVGLDGSYIERRPHELSGGEQRRVALARALAPRPRLVVLDEPFSGLDASLRVETREAVGAALREAGTTALLVTHDQAEALSLGRQVAVLRGGRLVQTAAPSVLYGSPADVDLARFVGDAVVLEGVARDGVITSVLGRLTSADPAIAGDVTTVIRPEQIRVHCATPGLAGVRATVIGRSYLGAETLVRLALGRGVTEVTAKVFSHDAPEIGEDVELSVAGPVVAYPRVASADSLEPPAQ